MFATSTWTPCRSWAWARTEWLVDELGADPGDIVLVQRKELIGGNVFLDDNTDNVRTWFRHHKCNYGHAFLFGASYNACELKPVDWPGFVKKVEEFMSR